MPEVAYRFVPYDEGEGPRENSMYTSIRDASEKIEVGSEIETIPTFLGHRRWQVVEVRPGTGGMLGAKDADGTPIPLGGTLVCRAID